jgi:hypothetical protein
MNNESKDFYGHKFFLNFIFNNTKLQFLFQSLKKKQILQIWA